MKFEITKQQILELNNNSEKLKEWFPEAFENVSGWYRDSEFPKWTMFADFENKECYGFDQDGNWYNKGLCQDNFVTPTTFEATEEEVFEALKNEAIKRGFDKKGIHFKDMSGDNFISNMDIYFFNNGNTDCSKQNRFNISVCQQGGVIYRNGKWATIIETITKSEAEKLLNKKIID